MTTKVLCVDDDKSLLEIAKTYLEIAHSIEVKTADSADSALRLLADEEFDTIVSDQNMPEMTGIELIRVLRNRGDNTPFILFTSCSRREALKDAIMSGVDMFLAKDGDIRAQFMELGHIIRQMARIKGAEDAMYYNNHRFKALIQNSSEVVLLMRDNGLVDFVSPGVQRSLGYSQKDFINRNLRCLVKDEDWDLMSRKTSNGGGHVGIVRVIHKDGRWRAFDTWVSLPEDTGMRQKILNMRDVTKEITEQRARVAAEERFRELFELSPFGMAIANEEGVIVKANEALARQLKASSARELSDRSLAVLAGLNGTELASLSVNGCVRREVAHKVPASNTNAGRDAFGRVYLDWCVTRTNSGYICQVQDTTGLRRAEDSLVSAFERVRQYAVLE
jgi:PAS domain S-box-containing protein